MKARDNDMSCVFDVKLNRLEKNRIADFPKKRMQPPSLWVFPEGACLREMSFDNPIAPEMGPLAKFNVSDVFPLFGLRKLLG